MQPRTPSVRAPEPVLPPRLKNHAAGQASDWAETHIPGQVKHWAYQTTGSIKRDSHAEDFTRVGSGYAKKRVVGDN